MLLILFQTVQDIGFSQVNASCLSPVPFFSSPNSQLIPSCTKHCLFTGSRELGNRKKWDERDMQRLPVKTKIFAHWGISCELGRRKKCDERHMQHLPVKTQCFFAVWKKLRIREKKNGTGSTKAALTCENTMFCAAWNQLRIRDQKKKGRETDRRHLLVKSQCFAQFGIRSAACRVWCFHNRVWKPKDVNTSESETVPTGGARHAAHRSWYRRWTKYSNPFYPVQPPRPKVQC